MTHPEKWTFDWFYRRAAKHEAPQNMNAPKISVDLDGLKALAAVARRNGKQDAFIDLALQWAEAALAEINRLKAAAAIAQSDTAMRECGDAPCKSAALSTAESCSSGDLSTGTGAA